MKVVELKGKDIMMAYDGHYLSRDFGYSCANFNTRDRFATIENDEEMFRFYTENNKNISCIVAYNDIDKISGRRMFFKGKSLINDKEFEYPIKQGKEVKYLYGYYGNRYNDTYLSINRFFSSKYGKGLVYMDNGVMNNGVIDVNIPNYFIMQVEKADFNKYPPIDLLSICPDLKALANFRPRQYVIDVLEKDFNKTDLNFYQAYRYSPNKKGGNFSYKTWADNYRLIDNIEEEDDDEEEEDYLDV